jgi:hypothetical protein
MTKETTQKELNSLNKRDQMRKYEERKRKEKWRVLTSC